MYDLQEQLDSEVTVVNTYHIVRNEASQNPEMNLKKNLKSKIGSNLDFMIIAMK